MPQGLQKKINQALGRSRGGFTTKIHILVDGLGNPMDFVLTGGEVHDNTQIQTLLAGKKTDCVIADRGYDSDETVAFIEGMNAQVVIPPKSNRINPRDCDWYVYKERHLVECFIGKIKHYRRVFSRFDKIAERFLTFVKIASAMIWLR